MLAPARGTLNQAEFPTRGRLLFFFFRVWPQDNPPSIRQSVTRSFGPPNPMRELDKAEEREKRHRTHTWIAAPLHSERSAFRTQKSRSLFRLAPDSNHTHPAYSAAASFPLPDHTRPELINVPSPDGPRPSSTRYVYLHWSCCNARALCFLGL